MRGGEIRACIHKRSRRMVTAHCPKRKSHREINRKKEKGERVEIDAALFKNKERGKKIGGL